MPRSLSTQTAAVCISAFGVAFDAAHFGANMPSTEFFAGMAINGVVQRQSGPRWSGASLTLFTGDSTRWLSRGAQVRCSTQAPLQQDQQSAARINVRYPVRFQ
jgi:hypothetical protein